MRRMKFAVLTLTILLILCACGVRETITPSASASETPFEETSSTARNDQSQLESPADPEDDISEESASEDDVPEDDVPADEAPTQGEESEVISDERAE